MDEGMSMKTAGMMFIAAAIWDRAVLRAIEGWAYAPAAAVTEGMEQRFDFNLGG